MCLEGKITLCLKPPGYEEKRASLEESDRVKAIYELLKVPCHNLELIFLQTIISFHCSSQISGDATAAPKPAPESHSDDGSVDDIDNDDQESDSDDESPSSDASGDAATPALTNKFSALLPSDDE